MVAWFKFLNNNPVNPPTFMFQLCGVYQCIGTEPRPRLNRTSADAQAAASCPGCFPSPGDQTNGLQGIGFVGGSGAAGVSELGCLSG